MSGAQVIDQEAEFHQAMLNTYRTAVAECNYRAKAFLSMVVELGGVNAAKKLLGTQDAQSGLYELFNCGRLDLTVEALVAEGRFRDLFDAQELAEAEARLNKLRGKQ